MIENAIKLLSKPGLLVQNPSLRNILRSSGFKELGHHRFVIPRSAVDNVLEHTPSLPSKTLVIPGNPSACVQYSDITRECTTRMFLELIPLMDYGFDGYANLFNITDVPEHAMDIALAYLLKTYSNSQGYYCVRENAEKVSEFVEHGKLCASVHQPLELQETALKSCSKECILFCFSEIGTTSPPWPEAAVHYALATYLGVSAVSFVTGGYVPVFGFAVSQHNPIGGSLYLTKNTIKAQYVASKICKQHDIPLALTTSTNSPHMDHMAVMENSLTLTHCIGLKPSYIFTGGWLNPEHGWCIDKMILEIEALKLLGYPKEIEEYAVEHTENWIFHEIYAQQYKKLSPEEKPMRRMPDVIDNRWKDTFIRISEELRWSPKDWLKQLESYQKHDMHGH